MQCVFTKSAYIRPSMNRLQENSTIMAAASSTVTAISCPTGKTSTTITTIITTR
jgi:hypothetical protein